MVQKKVIQLYRLEYAQIMMHREKKNKYEKMMTAGSPWFSSYRNL